MNGSDLVFITGAARSGTSMVAGVLKACGLDLGGPLVKATRHNPRGFFEHRAIRQKVIKPLLRAHGWDPRGQRKLPPRDMTFSAAQVAQLRRAIRVRLDGGRGYKDAKVLLVWPLFRAAFPDARWVLVRRDPKEIVASCIRTPFMKGRKYKQGWIEWVQEHEFRMEDLKASRANLVEVWPDPDEVGSFREAVAHAGLRWDPGAVRRALQPSAWHRRGAA